MSNHPRRSIIKNWPRYLRKFRITHGLTQKQLADGLMISARVVENWEGSINEPPAYLQLALMLLALKLSSKKA